MRAASIIVADEPYLLEPEEATTLAWLLRTLEIPDAPDLETAAMTAAVIIEDATASAQAGTRTLTVDEERAIFTVLEEAAQDVGLPPRLSRLHRALQQTSLGSRRCPARSRCLPPPQQRAYTDAGARTCRPRRASRRAEQVSVRPFRDGVVGPGSRRRPGRTAIDGGSASRAGRTTRVRIDSPPR